MFRIHSPSLRPRRALALMAAGLVALLFLGGCGSGDDTPPEQTSRQGRLVPANLDTLIAETGGERPADTEDATPPMTEGEGQGEVAIQSPSVDTEVAPEVVPEVVPEKVPEKAPEVLQPSGQGSFSVQLGSFSQPDNAETLAAKVRQQGRSAVVEAAQVEGRTYHRVLVRGLASRADAENIGEELRESLGINYLVLSK